MTSTLDKSLANLHLSFHSIRYSILRLPPSALLPPSFLKVLASPLDPSLILSLTRTPYETSLILPESLDDGQIELELALVAEAEGSYKSEGPWALLVVKGPMDLELTGVLHALTGPLKEAKVAIFASSTYDTDYVLVHWGDKEKAQKALRDDGWVFG